jgi:hypothetical protein
MIATELKFASIGIAACLIISGASFGVSHYKTKWQNEIHAQYAEATRQAIIKRNAEIERLRLSQEETNRKVVTDYEKQLKTLSDRLASVKRDGLRMPKTICSGIAATTEATSAERDNETSDFRLPDGITERLYAYASRAEEIKLQLGSCQKWIIENGFYPDNLTSKPKQPN